MYSHAQPCIALRAMYIAMHVVVIQNISVFNVNGLFSWVCACFNVLRQYFYI